MTKTNDWDLLSDELEAIKAIARHEGYEKAMDDLAAMQSSVQVKQDTLDKQRSILASLVHRVRTVWSKMTGEPSSWKDPKKDLYRYQIMFGSERTSDNLYIEMPENDEEFIYALNQLIHMATDFKKLLDAFETNPLVKAQWDRLLVSMRMTDAGQG